MKTWQELRAEALKASEIRNKLISMGHGYVGEFREGFAPVHDNDNYYHVDANNNPAYSRRFKFVGPFSNGTAPAKDELGWFHIYPDGSDVYSQRSRDGCNRNFLSVAIKANQAGEEGFTLVVAIAQ